MRNCTRDEGGPFGFSNQVLISSHRKLLRSRAVVVSVAETPGRGFRQARSREASASEPLQKCRKRIRRCQNRGGDPCMGLLLSRSFGRAAHSFPSFVCFLVRSESRFFVPTRALLTPARAGAVKVGRRTNLAACSAVARPHLDGFEHDGRLGAIGMTIRGEPAFGRGSIAPQPCIRWVQEPEP